jgi:hypothetical protein
VQNKYNVLLATQRGEVQCVKTRGGNFFFSLHTGELQYMQRGLHEGELHGLKSRGGQFLKSYTFNLKQIDN